jgi:hypothetical protein
VEVPALGTVPQGTLHSSDHTVSLQEDTRSQPATPVKTPNQDRGGGRWRPVSSSTLSLIRVPICESLTVTAPLGPQFPYLDREHWTGDPLQSNGCPQC